MKKTFFFSSLFLFSRFFLTEAQDLKGSYWLKGGRMADAYWSRSSGKSGKEMFSFLVFGGFKHGCIFNEFLTLRAGREMFKNRKRIKLMFKGHNKGYFLIA